VFKNPKRLQLKKGVLERTPFGGKTNQNPL